MKTYRIATIPGDGIGKEVIPAGQQVLQTLAATLRRFTFEFESFGSAGDPHIADHITLWGLRLKICQGFDQYANVRPTRILPGIDAPLKRCRPQDLDWVIVRENSEGEYAGVGGRVHQGHPIEAATDVSMMTRAGVERIMRFAFRLAQGRPRKLLTVVTKSNAQRHAMVMWDEIALQIAAEFQGLGQPGGHLLVLRDAPAPHRRGRSRAAPDAGRRSDHRQQRAAHARPGRHCHHRAGHGSGVRAALTPLTAGERR
jgi:tartrate dehydrogenase/decarboxylase/D-malate dehydrogenase